MTNNTKPGIGHNRPKKTEKERSKSYNERKTKAGYRRIWTNPAMLDLIDELGSIEEVFEHYSKLECETQKQSDHIQKLEQDTKQLVDLNITLTKINFEQVEAKNKQIDELDEQGRKLAKKNAELEQTAQKRADLIASQTSAFGELQADLEAERNRTLFDRIISALLRK
jgi:DNA repair exonuclease SbcCD ATPase subunit